MSGIPQQRPIADAATAVPDWLERLWQLGIARYAIGSLDLATFASHATTMLDERLRNGGIEPSPTERERLTALLPGADFVLLAAFQIADRDEVAGILHDVATPLLERVYRQLGASAEAAETRARETAETLVLGAFRRDGQPGFMSYEAKAPLESWLAGVAWLDWKTRTRAAARSKVVAESALPSAADREGSSLLDGRADAMDRSASVDDADLAQLLEAAMRAAVKTRQIEARDLDAFARATLSRRQHQVLAARLGIPASTFSRRKERGAASIARATRDALLTKLRADDYLQLRARLDAGESAPDSRLVHATRSFCRWALRHLRRATPDDRGSPSEGTT